MLWWIFGGTILVLVLLIGWVIWMNWIDIRTEQTLGRDFDRNAGREDEPRFRGPEKGEDGSDFR